MSRCCQETGVSWRSLPNQRDPMKTTSLLLLFWCLLGFSSCGADPVYAGQYRALYGGQSVVLDLEEDDAEVTGTVVFGDLVGQVQGTVEQGRVAGTVDSLAFGKIPFEAQREDDGSLTWTYLPTGSGQGPSLRLTFTRGEPASTSDETAPLDSTLVGHWRRTVSQTVSGIRPIDNLNTATDIYCQLAADGTFTYGSAVTSVGGSGISGVTQPGSIVRGRWKAENNVLFSKAEGSSHWTPLGQYSVSGNAMVLYVGQDKQLWER